MKNVFLCGAGSGFGLVLAKRFSENNFNVVVNSRKPIKDYENLVMDMNELNFNNFETYNSEIIINNGFDKKDYFHSFEASLNVIQEAMKFFKSIGGGTLVNINSFYGLYPDTKDPYYAAAKYGLRGFIESIEKEAFENNIRIINFYPRAIAIGLNEGRQDIDLLIDPEELSEFIVENINHKSFYISHVQIDRVN